MKEGYSAAIQWLVGFDLTLAAFVLFFAIIYLVVSIIKLATEHWKL